MKAEGDSKQAREYYEKALDILEKIVERTPEDFQALQDLSVSYDNLGDVSDEEGDRKQAKEYYEKALEGFEKIIELAQDDPQALQFLAYLQAKLEEAQPFWRRWFKRLFKR